MSRFTLGKDDKEGSLYDLFAVANHSGTVNFGHYTAFGRLAEADQTIDGLKQDGLGMYNDHNSLRLFVFVLYRCLENHVSLTRQKHATSTSC